MDPRWSSSRPTTAAHFRRLPYDFCLAGLIFSLPLITIGAANAFGWLLAYLRGAIVIAGWITGIAGSDPHLIMLLMVLLFTIVGDFIEPVPTIIIFMPLVNALTAAGNINPVHMGVVLIATLAFGLITPPYGLVLLMASKFVGVRFSQALRAVAADLRRVLRHDRVHDLFSRGRAVDSQARHSGVGGLLPEPERARLDLPLGLMEIRLRLQWGGSAKNPKLIGLPMNPQLETILRAMAAKPE